MKTVDQILKDLNGNNPYIHMDHDKINFLRERMDRLKTELRIEQEAKEEVDHEDS